MNKDKEYIEINDKIFPTPYTRSLNDYRNGWNACLNSVMQHKTVDVEPVQHGAWIDTDTFDFHCIHIYQCSNCRKEVADDYISHHKYCLHCGAKMDGGTK